MFSFTIQIFLTKSKCSLNNLYLGFTPGQGDGHHVEAHRGPGEALGLEEIIRQPAQPALLAGVHRVLRRPEARPPSGLDLHHHHRFPVPGDEVDLPQGRHIIAFQDFVALLLQGRCGQIFAVIPQLPSRVFHGHLIQPLLAQARRLCHQQRYRVQGHLGRDGS